MNVKFYGSVIKFADNEKFCNIKNCTSVRELINELGDHYGMQLKEFILGGETCFILVNGKGIMMTGGLNTKLQPDDKIDILPFAEAG